MRPFEELGLPQAGRSRHNLSQSLLTQQAARPGQEGEGQAQGGGVSQRFRISKTLVFLLLTAAYTLVMLALPFLVDGWLVGVLCWNAYFNMLWIVFFSLISVGLTHWMRNQCLPERVDPAVHNPERLGLVRRERDKLTGALLVLVALCVTLHGKCRPPICLLWYALPSVSQSCFSRLPFSQCPTRVSQCDLLSCMTDFFVASDFFSLRSLR